MANSSKLAPGSKLKVGTHEATVLKFLLEGGFAHIYKVSIEPAEDDLNIACLKRVLVPDKAGLNTLRKEVDAMKILRHGRNIARYYDSNAERLSDGTYEVLVLMALYPNGSLLDYMNANIKTKLLERQILKIMRDILLGVLEMHRLSLIHRDIKIENVLLDSQDNFILCDFGSTSAPIPPPTNQQEFDSILHDLLYQTTPQYRAPEMLDLNRGFPINDKADIWALGCFLYKLCYYTTPFEAQGQGDVAILSALYVIPPQPEYSSDLKNLIIIMLQENPIMRPNIVQIIMLVCELSREKFADLKVEDFYCQGPYNFLLLQQYQAERQYALNGLLNRNSGVPGVQQQPRSSQTSKYSSPTRLGRLPVVQPGPDHLAVPNTQRSQSAASSDRGNKGSVNSPLSVGSDAEDLDGISERFPLLDDMDISKPKSQVHSQVQQLQAHQHIPTQIAQPSGTNYQAAAQFPVAAPPVARVAASFPMATPPSINYPQPPAMLSPQELLKLLRDQLKHYNYLHQKYQYEVGLIQQQQQEYQKQYELYHQQYIQQYQQQQGNQNFANVQPQITPYPPPSTQTVQQSQQSQRLARKEAWESNKTGSIDNQTERLVSDIFGIGGASNSVPSSSIAGEDNILSKSRSHQSTKSVDIRSDVSLTSEPHISSVGPTGSNSTITPTVSNPGRPLSTKSTDNLSLESQITSQEKNSQISNISNDISHLEASIHEAEIKDDPQMDISEIDDNVGKDYDDLIQFEQQFPKALELKDMNSPLPQINLSEFKRFKNPEIQPANDGSANPFPMRSASGISSVQNEDLIKKEPSSKLEKSDRKEDHNPWGDFRPKDTKIAVKGPPLVLSESAKDISKNTESDYLPTASMTEAAQGISNLLISPENSYLMPQNGDSTLKYQTQGSQKALLSRTGSKPTSSQQYSKKVDNNTYQQVAISPELKPLAIKHDAQKAQKSQNGTDYHLSQSPEQFVKEKSRFTQPAFKLDPKGVKPSQFAYHNSNSSDFLVVKEDTADFNADDLLNLQQGTKKWTNGAANSMGLINLEVGLESSSASSTPVQRATVPDSDPGSLIDLGDIAPQQNTGDAKIKPKFVKNRVSLGLQIPSSLNFEEEVIDFDSDDENPNKKSSMSRLAIRNSLKTVKKAERWVSDRKPGERKSSERRSGEFKRSDSSGGEGKKRLSMFLP